MRESIPPPLSSVVVSNISSPIGQKSDSREVIREKEREKGKEKEREWEKEAPVSPIIKHKHQMDLSFDSDVARMMSPTLPTDANSSSKEASEKSKDKGVLEKKGGWMKLQFDRKDKAKKKDLERQKSRDKKEQSAELKKENGVEDDISPISAVQSYRHASTYNGRFTDEQTMILADFFLQVTTKPTPAQIDQLYNKVILSFFFSIIST